MRRPNTDPVAGLRSRTLTWLRRVLVPRLALALAGAIVMVVASPAFAQDAAAGPDAPEGEYEYDYDVDTDPAAIDDFRDRLEPHGTWVDDPTYGTVWVPDVVVVGEDFQPYRTAGRWGVTDAGDWVWVSDYDWGYIPFHYGRWIWIPARGWAWVPGRVYAPAWVVWRTGDPGYDYIGWAPAPPTFVWFGGVAVGFYATVAMPWWYCPSAYFFSPGWGVYVVHDHARVRHIHAHTHVHHHHGHHGHAKASAGGHHKAGASTSSGSGHSKAEGSTGSSPTAAGKVSPPSGAFDQKARSKSTNDYALHQIPKSPSFAEARVPPSAQPKKRVKPDQRATALRDSAPEVGRGGTARSRVSSRGAKSGPSATRATTRSPRARTVRRHRDGSFTAVPPVTRSNARSAGVRRLPPRDRGFDKTRTPSTRSHRATPSSRYRAPSPRYRAPSPRYRAPSPGTSSPRYTPSRRSGATRTSPSRRYTPPTTRSGPSRSSVRRSSPSRSAVKRSTSRSSSRSRSSSGSRSRSSSRSRSRR